MTLPVKGPMRGVYDQAYILYVIGDWFRHTLCVCVCLGPIYLPSVAHRLYTCKHEPSICAENKPRTSTKSLHLLYIVRVCVQQNNSVHPFTSSPLNHPSLICFKLICIYKNKSCLQDTTFKFSSPVTQQL